MQVTLPDTNKDYQHSSTVEKGTRHFHEFFAKFNHDWMMLSAAGLAYSLMVAVVPIGIAIIAVLGFTLGSMNPGAQAQILDRIRNIFPSAISSQNVLQPALTRLSMSAGFLTVLAVVFAIFGGSRLFVAIERCFDIVYRTHPRKAIPQNVMALLMMLVFIVLTPVMVFASLAPALILSLVRNSTISQLPGITQLVHNGFVLSVASILGSTIVAWILFQATYMAVPNQRVSFKHSWKGAIVAAILLELFLALFPFYITHFMRSYTGVAGFAVIFLLFFYYFALILLLGAQVNAYFAENVGPLPNTLAVVLLDAVGKHPEGTTSVSLANKANEQAGETTEPISTVPALSARGDEEALSTGATTQPEQDTEATPQKLSKLSFLGKKKQKTPGRVRPAAKTKLEQAGALMPTVIGTGLAFGLTIANLRKKMPGRSASTNPRKPAR
jgi:YihY family inner membrane protein